MKEFYLRIIGVSFIGIFCVLAILATLIINQRTSTQSKGYWHYVEGYFPRLSGGYGGAPDGTYTILITFINETDGVVGSPYSESYGGQLHGYWRYAEELRLDEGWYKVRLKDNIIVLAEEPE